MWSEARFSITSGPDRRNLISIGTGLLISGPFIKNLLHNHSVIYKIIIFFFPGEAEDSVIFSFFILLHKRAKPILPPYLRPHLRAR